MNNKNNNSDALDKRQRIWQVIVQIPAGKVASYGQIASLAGLPGAARLVGNVLKKLPEDSRLPWYRVINSQGKISLPVSSPSYKRQIEQLNDEGVIVLHNRISLKKYRWNP